MSATASLRAAPPGGAELSTGGAASSPVPPVILTLPMPPSANDLFRNVPRKGRVKTQVYTDWLGHAGWVLRQQRPGSVPGRVVVVVSIERASQAADIDNRVKALFDLLVLHKVMDDDRNVIGFAASWAPAANKLARVMVLPAAHYGFDFQLAKDGSGAGWFLQEPQPAQEFECLSP